MVEKIEKKLTSGKQVIMRTVTALDDVMAYQLIAEGVDKDNPFAAGLLHRTCLVLLSVISIDGKEFNPPSSLEEVNHKLASFGLRDWREIEKVYSDYNEPKEVTPGE